ncbi:MAG: hypothetical protein R2771_00035 [Saprospiraceae bacterium]
MRAIIRPMHFLKEIRKYNNSKPKYVLNKGIEVTFIVSNKSVYNRELFKVITETKIIPTFKNSERKSISDIGGDIFIKNYNENFYKKDWVSSRLIKLNYLKDDNSYGSIKVESLDVKQGLAYKLDLRPVMSRANFIAKSMLESILGISFEEYLEKYSNLYPLPNDQDEKEYKKFESIYQNFKKYIKLTIPHEKDMTIGSKDLVLGVDYIVEYLDDFSVEIN